MVKEILEQPQVELHKRGSKKGRMKKVKQRGVELSVPKIEGTAAHHIIPFSLHKHDIWKLSGMSVDARINIMLLPTKEGALWFATYRSIHDGGHTKEVTMRLKIKIDKLEEVGQARNFTQEQYQKELKKIIMDERYLLRKGKRNLNKHTRESIVSVEKQAELMAEYYEKVQIRQRKALRQEEKVKDEEIRIRRINNAKLRHKLKEKVAEHFGFRLPNSENKNRPKSRAKANNKNAERKEKQEKKSKIKFSPVKINKNIPGKTPKSVKKKAYEKHPELKDMGGVKDKAGNDTGMTKSMASNKKITAKDMRKHIKKQSAKIIKPVKKTNKIILAKKTLKPKVLNKPMPKRHTPVKSIKKINPVKANQYKVRSVKLAKPVKITKTTQNNRSKSVRLVTPKPNKIMVLRLKHKKVQANKLQRQNIQQQKFQRQNIRKQNFQQKRTQNNRKQQQRQQQLRQQQQLKQTQLRQQQLRQQQLRQQQLRQQQLRQQQLRQQQLRQQRLRQQQLRQQRLRQQQLRQQQLRQQLLRQQRQRQQQQREAARRAQALAQQRAMRASQARASARAYRMAMSYRRR
ncbi:MAG: hypothetical protein COB50_05115 [Thiotrichales bacterium]|nr:MAG: hypothetical protein COB50_05115 [Thiotrichales bacterium]